MRLFQVLFVILWRERQSTTKDKNAETKKKQ
jgi:hypothetical protein